LRDRDKLVPWFGRILETSLANHRRRRAAESRMESRLGPDSHAPAPVADLHWLSCQCLEAALASIRPDQAGLVRSVDLRGIPLRQVARELGVRSNTAAARLHRARRATARALVQLCRFCRLHWGFDCLCLVASGQAAAGPSGHRCSG
jgi:RNA polymerase sigma-70 factor (ECF subfamily)